MPSDNGSSSSTDLVAGCAIERPLGDGVWEAVQPELGRRVALRLYTTPFTAGDWPEHPGVVDLLTVVDRPDGTYVATRFIPGARTLADRRAAGASRADIRRWVDAAAATLAQVTHGDLTEHDILIGDDGRALVTGFGRGATGDDDDALARMRPRERSRGAVARPRRGGGRRRRRAAGERGRGRRTASHDRRWRRRRRSWRAPPRWAARCPADGIVTVDCAGEAPSGSSLPCTFMQGDLPGTQRWWRRRRAPCASGPCAACAGACR